MLFYLLNTPLLICILSFNTCQMCTVLFEYACLNVYLKTWTRFENAFPICTLWFLCTRVKVYFVFCTHLLSCLLCKCWRTRGNFQHTHNTSFLTVFHIRNTYTVIFPCSNRICIFTVKGFGRHYFKMILPCSDQVKKCYVYPLSVTVAGGEAVS